MIFRSRILLVGADHELGVTGVPSGQAARLGGVGLGRGPGIALGPFPQAARRTCRVPLDATGSPWSLPSGWLPGSPWAGDLAAAVAVPGDRDRRDPPQFDLARIDGPPPSLRGCVLLADVLSLPVVPRAQHADHPSPGEVVEHAEGALGDRVPEVVGPAVRGPGSAGPARTRSPAVMSWGLGHGSLPSAT